MTGVDILRCFQGNRKCICYTGILLSKTHVMTMKKRKWTAMVKILLQDETGHREQKGTLLRDQSQRAHKTPK